MSNWEDYAKNVLRDSFALWERGEHVAMFAGVVLGSLLLGVILVFGITIQFTPEAGLWASGLLLSWLIILVFVVSPYRIWRRERKKVEEYEDAARPKINVNWRFRSNRAELILTNISLKTLPRIELSFRNYRMSDGSNVTDVICDMRPVDERGPPISLDPGVQTFFRFANVRRVRDRPAFIELTPSGREEIRIGDREIGVKMAVSGENIPGQAIVLRLTLNDDDSLLMAPWSAGENAVRPGEGSDE